MDSKFGVYENESYLRDIEQKINDILLNNTMEISYIPYGVLIRCVISGNTNPLEDFIADYNLANSTERNKEMSNNTVSPALFKIEERIKQLKQLERDSDDVALDIQKHKNAIEELTFKLDELNEDVCHINKRIHQLLNKARINEGFTEEYLSRFLKERGY